MESIIKRIKLFGLKNTIICVFFQRVLRINSHVPWPVHWSSIVSNPDKIVKHHGRPYLGYSPGCYIQAKNGIEIGINVRVGPGVKIISANHDIYNFDIYVKDDPIIIGDNCWLGANCVILPGVRLGNHVIVGAGAVVTKNFPDNCIIAGVPANIVREIGDYSGDLDS